MGKITYITPSFYSSVYYWRNRDGADKQELLDLIDKVPPKTTELMQAGIDFEDDVFKMCEDETYVSKDNVACEVYGIVKGSLWQQKISTNVERTSEKVMIFGRMDCVKRDYIYDIKCVGSYELGKYYNSIQHLSYMKATGINNFKYLVKCGSNLYSEEYHYDNSDNLLTSRVFSVIDWLKTVGLYDRYLKKWEIKI